MWQHSSAENFQARLSSPIFPPLCRAIESWVASPPNGQCQHRDSLYLWEGAQAQLSLCLVRTHCIGPVLAVLDLAAGAAPLAIRSRAGVLLGPGVHMVRWGSSLASSLPPPPFSSLGLELVASWEKEERVDECASKQAGRWAVRLTETAKESRAKPAVCPPTHSLVLLTFSGLPFVPPGRVGRWAATALLHPKREEGEAGG